MDKRSWLWKKKLGDRTLSSAEADELSSSKHFNDQTLAGLTSDHAQISNVAPSQDQTEEKIRVLNERLLAADHLVKQHVKVAEEAVSGWEKSKAENISLKRQLEAVLEQKQGSDDRLSQMEGALKESMWQLRQMREVQEQTIHDAVVKKTREWQNVRLELEQRLADADQQLVESGFQNSLLSKRVEEQAETVAQLNQACSRAEGRVDTLQVRVETFERENASLKYEVTVLNKELIIRNQEREMNKKSLDVASRQKAESSKKLHKLEIECQRLRALVRKKLPGPGALVQMKLEVEGLDTERRDSSNRWRSDSKPLNSPKAAGSIVSSEGDFSDRLLTMEEETKMLKEVLSERNNELQTARIMCARMAEKLSVFERQVGKTLNSPQKSLLSQSLHGVDSFVSLSSLNELSHASLSEDGIEDDRSVADSLASTLATELAHFRKEGMATFQEPRTSQKVSAPLDSMEDFIEVERLVSLSSEHSTVTEGKMTEAMAASKEALSMKEAELQLAVGQCAELNKKLALTEQQLCLLSSKNAANELNLYSLQQKLNMILEKLEDGNEVRAIEGIKSALSDSQCSSVDGLQAHVTKLSKVSSNVSSEARESPTEKSLGIKLSGVESDLRGAIEEMIHILEVLASETRTHHDSTTCCEDFIPAHSVMSQNLFDSSSTITNLKSSANQFMQGEMELIQLIKSLSSVLVHIRVPGRSVPVPQINKERQNHDQQEVLSDAGSPISNTSNCEIYEQPGVKASNVGKKMTSVKESQLDCELRMLRAEKAALESHMKAEFSRMDKVEEMLLQLQREKSELLQALEVEKEKLESAKSQMLDAEHLIATLRVRLASAEMSRNTADERLTYANAENSKLTLQLQEQQSELMNMRESLKTLEECLEEERTRNGELQFRLDEVQSSLERANAEVEANVEKNIKEEGIASATEKLAECQRTILILSKQIQNMVSARASLSICNELSVCNDQKDCSQLNEFEQHVTGSTTFSSKRGQRVHSDPVELNMGDITDEELVSAAKGEAKANERKMSHEEYIEAVSQQLPSSPEADANTKIVPYVSPKKVAGKKNTRRLASTSDITKSIDSNSIGSPRRANSFTRFFSRNKKTLP